MSTSKTTLILEPYYGGSHRLWADNLCQKLGARLLSLPARHWKWRMHHAAHHFAQIIHREELHPSLIICSSMMDVAALRGLCPGLNARFVYYMHENQLSYPDAPEDTDVAQSRDRHYAFVQMQSCLAADEVWFNSHYHQEDWPMRIEQYLSTLPDFAGDIDVSAIRQKSRVEMIPLNLRPFLQAERKPKSSVSTLLWNHRWDYDKAPEEYLDTLCRLQDEGYDFRLVFTGEPPKGKRGTCLEERLSKLESKTLHRGFVERQQDYAGLLASCNILPVCSRQEFFGISVVEAMAAGVHPLLPNRLSYPELLQGQPTVKCYPGSIYEALRAMLCGDQECAELRGHVRRFHDGEAFGAL